MKRNIGPFLCLTTDTHGNLIIAKRLKRISDFIILDDRDGRELFSGKNGLCTLMLREAIKQMIGVTIVLLKTEQTEYKEAEIKGKWKKNWIKKHKWT